MLCSFQDDIFPPTRALWEATVSADEWFGGSEKTAPRVSLRPDDMQGNFTDLENYLLSTNANFIL